MISANDIDPAVLDLAENLNSAMPLAPGEQRFALDDAVVWLGGGDHPALTVVQRLRFGEHVDAARVEVVREQLRAHGRSAATWEIGPSATPHDAMAQLIALGMQPFEEPTAAAMILRRPLPPTVTTRLVVREALDIADAVRASEVLNAVFAERSETPDERRARVSETFEAYRASGRRVFVALLDGRAVAAAHAIYWSCRPERCHGRSSPTWASRPWRRCTSCSISFADLKCG